MLNLHLYQENVLSADEKIELKFLFKSICYFSQIILINENTYHSLLGSAYELDLATRPIEVVLILCSPVSFKLINHLFSFSPNVD